MSRIWLMGFLAAFSLCGHAVAQTREEKVRHDMKVVEADGFWIYNDLPRAFDEAKSSGKPILAVLRCIPCEETLELKLPMQK
jgi:serine protease Do